MKKIYSLFLIAAVLAACVGCKARTHQHSFGEWETKMTASCDSAAVEARTCACGEEQTREGDPATGHTFTAIAAVSVMEKPMAGMTVTASDLRVTATCAQGESVTVTEGITVENATLALGKNTVTVKYGELSTTVDIEASELDIALDASVTDDAYISSGSKDKENSSKKEMGTKVDQFRVYLRINVHEIIDTDLFAANKANAKVQLILPITSGITTDKTTFKLRSFAPAAGVTDVDFSRLTWNSVAETGAYSGLNWSNAAVLLDAGTGYNAAVENDQIIITLAYSQIADFVDENGNIVFAFATNTDGLKIGSLENKAEETRPAVKIVLNGEHFHIFDQEVTQSKYLVSANCKAKAKYRVSCACGEAGAETFTYGSIIDHAYGEAIPEKLNTCTESGVKEHYQCNRCGKYFLYRDGQMKLVTEADVKLSAGHDYKLIPQKEPTCTETGNNKYYKCGLCGKYFDARKNETTKEEQKLQKLEHSYGDLIPEQANTCSEAGVKAHYECAVCGKTFLERDGEKILVKAEDIKLSAGHDYKLIPPKEPTCTETGNNKYYKCGLCGKYFDARKNETTKEEQKIEKLAHSYGELIPEQASTCTEEGVKAHYECAVCGKTFLEKDGEKVLVKAEDLKLSAGHDYKLIPQKEPTCTETGNNKYYKCGLCGKYFDTQKNETTKEDQKLEKLGHSYGELIPEQASTCTEDGVKAHYECEACGKTFLDKNGEMILVKAEDLKLSAGHDMKVIGANESTCTKEGNNKYYQCRVCGKYFIDKEGTTETTKEEQKLEKLAHSYGELIPEQASTCTEDGVKAHYECAVCGKTFLDKNGEMILVKAEDLKLSAGHDIKVIGAKEPTCIKDGNNKYYQCKVCSKYFTDKEGTTETTKEEQKIEALGHACTSISAVSNMDNPMETMVVKAEDLRVTGTCGTCGESFDIAEGLELENAKLALGENVITVKYGALSTTVTIEATQLYIVLDGTVTDDTYVYASGKDKEYTDREELGTYSSSYRAYFRVNLSSILENELYLANQENAKLQVVLAVTSGSVLDSTSFTLKAYAPAAGGTDAPFSGLTWNSVDNKEGSIGAYSQLHWSNGVALTPEIQVENSKVIIELSCSQILDYIDQQGNILFAFATNTSGLKVGSMENSSNEPAVRVIIDGSAAPVRFNALKMMVLPYQQSKHRCFDVFE